MITSSLIIQSLVFRHLVALNTLEIDGIRESRAVFGISLPDNRLCNYQDLFRDLLAINPVFEKVELRAGPTLLKQCLSLTDKFTDLSISVGVDMVTFPFRLLH